MKTKPATAAIIVAAGSGKRMGGISKPLIPLGSLTVYERVIDAFVLSSTIDEIVVVCKDMDALKALSAGVPKKITFVLGGESRSESVYNGIISCKSEFVCIHDCARPFIRPDDIDRINNAAYIHGSACACSGVTDTIKYADYASNLVYTPKRDFLLSVQTPQVFSRDMYTVSFQKAKSDRLFTTDDTAIAENAGFKVEYIDIGSYNFKLTTADDIKLAKAMVFLDERGL